MTETHLVLGAGFIGRHVALGLARRGHRVTLASRRPPADARAKIAWEFLELGSADWDRLVADVDVVHHYAWGSIPASANANPGGDLLTNVGATIDLLDALRRRGGGRVVFSSSGGTVYGRLHEIPVPEDHVMVPINAYGAGKVAAETYFGLYRAMHGLDCRIARIANPYGAGQNLSRGLGAVTTFIHHALNQLPITIWGNGEVVRDYIHISDVVNCLIALAGAPRGDHYIFNVGSGAGVTLNAIVAELESQLGVRLDVTRTAPRPIDVPVSVLSIERAKSILAWSPALSFAAGIARSISDLRRQDEFSTID